MRRRVLFVSHSADLYGSERSLLSLAGGLKKNGRFDITVLVPGEGALTSRLRDRGIETFVLPYKRWIHHRNPLAVLYHAFWNLVSMFQFRNVIRRMKPELIYSNSVTNGFGSLLARQYGIPHICHIREFVHEDLDCRFDWGIRPTALFLNRVSSRVICNSEAVFKKWKKWFSEDKLSVVYNGFDFVPDKPGENGNSDADSIGEIPKRILMFNAIHPGKGIEDAIRAVAILRRADLPVELVIAGKIEDTHYARRLKRLCREESIDAHVQWLGFIDDPARQIHRSGAVLITSRNEAFGRVAVEALSRGKPVIGTRSGGLPEIIQDGVNGSLYTPGNSEELAQVIVGLFTNPKRTRRLALKGRETVLRRFGLDQYVSRLENIFEAVS